MKIFSLIYIYYLPYNFDHISSSFSSSQITIYVHLFLYYFHKSFDQFIDLLWFISIWIMSSTLDPFNFYTGSFVPLFIVSDTWSCMIFISANKQGRALYLIWKIRFYSFCKYTIPVPGKFGISFLRSVVCHHHAVHQRSAVFGFWHTVDALLQKQFPRIMPINGLHSFQKP